MGKAKAKAKAKAGGSINPVTKQIDAILAKAEFIPDDIELERGDKGTSLENFLVKGEAKYKVDANPQMKNSPDKMFLNQEYLVLIDDARETVLINRFGQCFLLREFDGAIMYEDNLYPSFLKAQPEWSCPVPDAQLIPSLYEDCVFDCINNADEEMEYSNSVDQEGPHAGSHKISLKNQSSLSFTCLGRFADGGGCKGSELLRDGLVKVVDWSADETRKVSKADKRKLGSKNTRASVRPPEAGFVYNSGQWHRSGFVLLTYNGSSLLFGVDDDTYFGCELPKKAKPQTISEAVAALAPPTLEGMICTRQGEWFFEQVEANKVPSIVDSVAYSLPAYVEDCMICLPKKDEESNTHAVVCDEWRVGKDGFIYAKYPAVFHSEHPKTEQDGWVRFHENTAIRSFSVAGVD